MLLLSLFCLRSGSVCSDLRNIYAPWPLSVKVSVSRLETNNFGIKLHFSIRGQISGNLIWIKAWAPVMLSLSSYSSPRICSGMHFYVSSHWLMNESVEQCVCVSDKRQGEGERSRISVYSHTLLSFIAPQRSPPPNTHNTYRQISTT